MRGQQLEGTIKVVRDYRDTTLAHHGQRPGSELESLLTQVVYDVLQPDAIFPRHRGNDDDLQDPAIFHRGGKPDPKTGICHLYGEIIRGVSKFQVLRRAP